MDQDTQEYTLGSSAEEQERLEAQRALYGDTSAITIAEGSRVVELGCGPGVNLWIARQVGPSGVYVGVDINGEQLTRAGMLAELLGLDSAIFVEASADDVKQLKRNEYDVVFIRLLLVHMRNAEGVVKEAFRLLKSGGKVIIIEPEDTTVKAGPDKDNLVTAWRAKSLYTVVDRNAVVMDYNRIRDYLRRAKFKNRTVTPHVVAANGGDPDRCRALLGNWVSMIERVEGELLEHDFATPEVIKAAKREASVVEPDTTAELTMWVGMGVKP
jgi:Methylase involved in ubiquinone/menaquinone biosynthesis